MSTTSVTLPAGTQDRAQPLKVQVNWTATGGGEQWSCRFVSGGFGGFEVIKPYCVKLRYRLVGAPSWIYLWGSSDLHNQSGTYSDFINAPAPHYGESTWYNPNAAYYTFASNALAAGTYEFQSCVTGLVYPVTNISGWSASYNVTVATVPNPPSVASPAAGATITNNAYTFQYTPSVASDAAQIQVIDPGTGDVLFDESVGFASTTSQVSTTLPAFPTNNVSRIVQIRTRATSGGLWGGWTARSVTVSWAAPSAPTLGSVQCVDAGGLMGFNWAISMSVGVPSSITRIWARPQGDTSAGVLVGTHTPAGNPETILWYGPASGSWQVRAEAVDTNGTSSFSAWTSATGTIACKGVTIHDPAAQQATILCLPLNGDGVSEERTVESALLQYIGREFPVVEFGTGGSKAYSIDLAAEGALTTTEIDKLKALMERRSVLCYRDRRGRVMYGLLQMGAINDRAWGETSSMVMTQTYSPTAPPSDVTP